MTSKTVDSPELDRRMANAIRMLAVDAVEKARSGHPGAPMGMADIAQVLWHKHLAHNPRDPKWPNRDRFVLSNGHGSMLLYALLHLTGYDLPIEELKNFRQLHSKTPGHPEVGVTPGVETTTGPLGQGISNAVGMALAEKLLALEFNRREHKIVDHFTYAFLGDGCLMEGISHEACSLAGTWKLSKLIAFWDDNGISIDGHVQGWFTDDTAARFRAYGWNVISGIDGHRPQAIDDAISQAKAQAQTSDGKPTLICCKTEIGHGSPNKAGGHDVHGAALGAAEVSATRTHLGWSDPPFLVPNELAAAWNAQARGAEAQSRWRRLWVSYRDEYPVLAAELERRQRGELTVAYREQLPHILAKMGDQTAPVATRKASQQALDLLAPLIPEFLGGSADLTGSNLTAFKGNTKAGPDDHGQFQGGNYLSYGVREFGMAAIMNGVALHGGFIPYGGTFLTFSDYSRNAIRMAALMRQRVIHVFTHDSIGLGEDGPTHQSVEHLPSLRLIPGLDVWRPADALETAIAWASAVERADGPSALALSRQNLPRVSRIDQADEIRRGGYVLVDVPKPDAILIATGSETHLAVHAQEALASLNIACRVISMPCSAIFDRQNQAYQDLVLPPSLPAVAIEAAHPDLWRKYVGRQGRVVGINSFGESAPAEALYQHFGITVQAVVEAATDLCRSLT